MLTDEELADSNSAGAANDSDADSQALVIDEEKKGTKRKAPAAPLSTPVIETDSIVLWLYN